jgi:hypothetical protein
MADALATYAFEYRGGLVSNLSPLQQGLQQPGSARILRNFEPSIEGGYKRILGYSKFDSSIVPGLGAPKVHGGSQTGTSLVIGNLFDEPEAGDTFTISGVTGTYTIAAGGVSYSSSTKRATLTLTTSLDSSPADKADVTFTANRGNTTGLAAWQTYAIAFRNNNLYRSTGSGWTLINVTQYGTPLVNGGSQTGGTLNIDGLTSAPQLGDTFTIAGVDLIYTITATPTVTSGASALSISPNLASSPANDAAITFLTSNKTSTNKQRFTKYRIGTTEKIAGVDGTNFPFTYDATNYVPLTGAPTDVKGASHVAFFKNHLFFAKGDVLSFTAPYTDSDFNAANGAGNISVGTDITGLIAFREQLIIFSENKIERLVGNTLADFILQPITDNIGCVDSDTIKEVAGDIVFLGPDGIRSLSSTDKIGDFNLAIIAKNIQKQVTDLITANQSFSSVTIKSKSQYRLLGHNESITSENATGILGTQLAGPEGTMFGWAELRGFKAFVADSNYNQQAETVIFANSDGYVYQMESGNSLDGANIQANFATPFVPLNDPQLRKTVYKMHLYTDPSGSISIDANLKFDLDEVGVIQPDAITFSNTGTVAGIFGNTTSTYGTSVYGGRLKKQFTSQTIGSGFNVSIQFFSNTTNPPFSLDATVLEFGTYDRR